jgi:hypothetical protein
MLCKIGGFQNSVLLKIDDLTKDKRHGFKLFSGSGVQVPDTSLDNEINFITLLHCGRETFTKVKITLKVDANDIL